MIDSAGSDHQASLDALLAARARAASDGRLVLDIIVGAALLSAALLWRPFAWVVIGSVGSCLLAFGAWGISDRELRERTSESSTHGNRSATVLVVCRAAAGVVGVVSALLLMLALCAMALGTWVS